jgi:hypothetical protein
MPNYPLLPNPNHFVGSYFCPPPPANYNNDSSSNLLTMMFLMNMINGGKKWKVGTSEDDYEDDLYDKLNKKIDIIQERAEEYEKKMKKGEKDGELATENAIKSILSKMDKSVADLFKSPATPPSVPATPPSVPATPPSVPATPPSLPARPPTAPNPERKKNIDSLSRALMRVKKIKASKKDNDELQKYLDELIDLLNRLNYNIANDSNEFDKLKKKVNDKISGIEEFDDDIDLSDLNSFLNTLPYTDSDNLDKFNYYDNDDKKNINNDDYDFLSGLIGNISKLPKKDKIKIVKKINDIKKSNACKDDDKCTDALHNLIQQLLKMLYVLDYDADSNDESKLNKNDHSNLSNVCIDHEEICVAKSSTVMPPTPPLPPPPKSGLPALTYGIDILNQIKHRVHAQLEDTDTNKENFSKAIDQYIKKIEAGDYDDNYVKLMNGGVQGIVNYLAERKRKEQEEAERKRKEQEEAERKRKEQEEAERKRKEQEEAERKRKEQEEAERKRQEERKRKEAERLAEEERKRKEAEILAEQERKRKEAERLAEEAAKAEQEEEKVDEGLRMIKKEIYNKLDIPLIEKKLWEAKILDNNKNSDEAKYINDKTTEYLKNIDELRKMINNENISDVEFQKFSNEKIPKLEDVNELIELGKNLHVPDTELQFGQGYVVSGKHESFSIIEIPAYRSENKQKKNVFIINKPIKDGDIIKIEKNTAGGRTQYYYGIDVKINDDLVSSISKESLNQGSYFIDRNIIKKSGFGKKINRRGVVVKKGNIAPLRNKVKKMRSGGVVKERRRVNKLRSRTLKI